MGKKVILFNKHCKIKGGTKMNTVSNIKPIQATPELTGKDALNFIEQVFTKPKKQQIEKNNRLLGILQKINK